VNKLSVLHRNLEVINLLGFFMKNEALDVNELLLIF
jgi:hypothetical protein